MGSGASTSGPSPVNPRVEHAMDVAGKAKKVGHDMIGPH